MTADPSVPAPAFSQREFRHALGQFATGVTIVTACNDQGEPVGMTVSSFNSVSLAPSLVLWSIGNHTSLLPVFTACSHYAIHVLSHAQQALALQFASRGVDRFAGVQWQANAHGVPVIAGALATFECAARSRYTEGDHVILIGEVLACHTQEGSPLLYHGGQMMGLR